MTYLFVLYESLINNMTLLECKSFSVVNYFKREKNSIKKRYDSREKIFGSDDE